MMESIPGRLLAAEVVGMDRDLTAQASLRSPTSLEP